MSTSTVRQRRLPVVWSGLIGLVAVIVVIALILSYVGFNKSQQVCPAEGCKGVTSASSNALMTIDIGPHNVSTTFQYPGVPSSFKLGTYTFSTIYNDTGYVSANGTQYPGFDVVFSVANVTQSQPQIVVFEWSSITPAGSQSTIPSVPHASIYLGTVILTWSTTSPAYPEAKSPALFLTVTVYQKPPSY